MVLKEEERSFLQKAGECLVSLPFDLKVLQEAMTDPDLDREAREIAAGTIMHALAPHEGEPGPLRYFDDVLYVRAALKRVVADGSEGAQAFAARFGDIYEKLEEELILFERSLGDLWPWLLGKLPAFRRLVYKGKRPAQCVDDEEVASFLYEEGLEFQTNYSVTEEKVRNKLRNPEQLLEFLERRRSDDLKKKP